MPMAFSFNSWHQIVRSFFNGVSRTTDRLRVISLHSSASLFKQRIATSPVSFAAQHASSSTTVSHACRRGVSGTNFTFSAALAESKDESSLLRSSQHSDKHILENCSSGEKGSTLASGFAEVWIGIGLHRHARSSPSFLRISTSSQVPPGELLEYEEHGEVRSEALAPLISVIDRHDELACGRVAAVPFV